METMKTQRFLIATEGTFDGRSISAEEIQSILMNFKAGRIQVDVGYEFYSWTPNMGKVAAMSVNYKASKMCLYAEVTVTPALLEIAASPVAHYLVPAIHTVHGETTKSVLVAVGVTQNPIIPDLDRLQFKVPNHQHLPFCEPAMSAIEKHVQENFSARVFRRRYFLNGNKTEFGL